MVQHTAIYYNGGPIEGRVWSIERRHFQLPWTTPTPSFKVRPFFGAEYLINGRPTTYRPSFNEIPTWTYTRPTQQCHFEWPWVTLSDLAKYSITWSVFTPFHQFWQQFVQLECCVYIRFFIQKVQMAPNFTFSWTLVICKLWRLKTLFR